MGQATLAFRNLLVRVAIFVVLAAILAWSITKKPDELAPERLDEQGATEAHSESSPAFQLNA